MSTCNKITKGLNLIFRRAVIFPVLILYSPLLFILFGEGGCKESTEDIKTILKAVWYGDP